MNVRLANLGPKSEAMMRRAGITTEEQLRSLGAARAYVMVKRSGSNASLNLLWGLEAALTNRPWREVARTDRLSLMLQVEQLMSADHMRSNRAAHPEPLKQRTLSQRSSRRPGGRER